MEPTDLIVAHGLRISRGAFTLELPDWRVAPGQVVGLVGPNGAGKTTLLETLAGLTPRRAGELKVLGHDPWRDPVAVRSQLGLMSDGTPLFDLRVGPLLQMLSGYYATWDAALVEQLIDRFEVDPQARVSALSTGQGTRVRLIAAMAFRPRVLLLDEPAAGLDLAGRRALLESVLDVVRDPVRSVVVSSHQLHDVHRVSDRLLVLDRGRVVQDGPTDALVGEQRTLEEAMVAWQVA